PATKLPTAQLRSRGAHCHPAKRHDHFAGTPTSPAASRVTSHQKQSGMGLVEEPRSDWRRAVAAVSERRVAEGRALYTERRPAELYRGARSSERERYARQASRLGAKRHSTNPIVPFVLVTTISMVIKAPT